MGIYENTSYILTLIGDKRKEVSATLNPVIVFIYQFNITLAEWNTRNKPDKPFPLPCSEPMDQDNNREASEQQSHHALRQRCLSALAAVSIQPSVVQESTPVLLEVLSSAHTGDLRGRIAFLLLMLTTLIGGSRLLKNKQRSLFRWHKMLLHFLISCLNQSHWSLHIWASKHLY